MWKLSLIFWVLLFPDYALASHRMILDNERIAGHINDIQKIDPNYPESFLKYPETENLTLYSFLTKTKRPEALHVLKRSDMKFLNNPQLSNFIAKYQGGKFRPIYRYLREVSLLREDLSTEDIASFKAEPNMCYRN